MSGSVMYRRLSVLALGTFAVGTDSFVVAGLLPQIADDLNVSPSVAGQLITTYALSYAVLSPIAAAVTGRWPRRLVLLVGLAIFALGTIGSAIVTSYAAVLISRAFAGLGGALFTPTASGVAVAMAPPDRRGRALAVVLAGLTTATALGAPLGTAVAAVADWRVTMVAVAGLGVVAGVGVAAVVTAPAPPRIALRARLAPARDRRVALVLATTLLAFTGLYTVYSYLPLAMEPVTGGNGQRFAILLLLWGLSATVGNMGAGVLTDRLGSRRIVYSALAILIGDFALLPWTSATTTGAVIALVAWGVAGWAMVVAQQSWLAAVAPGSAPLVIALNSATLYLAVSASGVVGGIALTAVDPDRLGLVGAVFLAVAFVPALLAPRQVTVFPAVPAKPGVSAEPPSMEPPSAGPPSPEPAPSAPHTSVVRGR